MAPPKEAQMNENLIRLHISFSLSVLKFCIQFPSYFALGILLWNTVIVALNDYSG